MASYFVTFQKLFIFSGGLEGVKGSTFPFDFFSSSEKGAFSFSCGKLVMLLGISKPVRLQNKGVHRLADKPCLKTDLL